MELTAFQSIICELRSRRIRLSAPAMASSFPKGLCGISSLTVPRSLAQTGSSSRKLCLSFRVLRPEPARSLSTPSTFLGVPFPFATSTDGVHVREHPKLASFRPRSFSLPRRFAPPPALWVYFTPQPRPGFTLQGFALPHSRTTSSMAVALVTFDCASCRTPCEDRLQLRSPAFRALLRARIRCTT